MSKTALVIAMVMVVGMSVTAFADTADGNYPKGTGTFTITITPNADDKGTHTYDAYQIFSGDLKVETVSGTQTKTLSNITWGSGVSDTATAGDPAVNIYGALATLGTDFTGLTSASAVAEALGASSDTNIAKKFADVVAPYLTTTKAGSSTATTNANATISVTGPGYYLVQDNAEPTTTTPGDVPTAMTNYIVQVVSDVTVAAKSSIPTVEKKVDDKIDSATTEDTITWQDTADYDIGDDVPFQLKGTLPTNYADYETYSYEFVDTLGAGLSYNNDAQAFVKIGTKWYAIDSTVTTTDGLSIKIANLKNVTSGKEVTFNSTDTNKIDSIATTNSTIAITNESEIYVRYTAKLTGASVVVGEPGNPNTVKLVYSNNPNGSGTGETKPDTVVVFTYELDVDKLNGADYTDLNNAGFTLLKKYAAIPADVSPTAISASTTYTKDTWYSETVSGTTTYWKAVDVIAAARDKHSFSFKGIDDGNYRLIESETPSGYNTMTPIDFTVSASHAADPNDLTKLASLTQSGLTAGTASATNGYISGGTFTFTKADDNTKTHDMTTESGHIPTAIENNQGTILPSTGGMGTTIFYIIGAILVVGAGVVLITRRRMQAEK